ncbi:unnamed protein product [Tilletia controversa]|nr:unnamed protein product [Tilletia controversa]
MTSIHPARAKDGKPKPNGAWSPEEVDFLTESIQKGSFHVLCPDNETLREVDMARMQWNISDIIEDRQTLSRWLDEWEPKFSECMGAAAIHQKPRSIGRTFHCSRGPDVLAFFPQVREKDANFVSLAGDFRGTTNGIIYDISSNKQVPAVIWQQAADSQIFTALANAGGLTAIVPTTSIYSSSDEIVKPENNSTSATSYLAGATNVLAQKYCPGISLFHGGMLYSNFSMSVAKGALTSPSKVWNPSTFTKGYCGGYVADGLSGSDKDKVQFLIFKDAIRMSSSKYAIPCEPLLPAYIKKYAAANPPCHAKISSFLAL